MICALCTNAHETFDCPKAATTIAAHDHPFTWTQTTPDEPESVETGLPALSHQNWPTDPLGGAVAVGCATVVQ